MFRQYSARATWSLTVAALPAKSEIVGAILRTRWNARAAHQDQDKANRKQDGIDERKGVAAQNVNIRPAGLQLDVVALSPRATVHDLPFGQASWLIHLAHCTSIAG